MPECPGSKMLVDTHIRPKDQRGRAPAARLLVARELLRAVAALILLPARLGAYLLRRRTRQAELLADLQLPAQVDPDPQLPPLPERPLRIFLSCAEPSGEEHALGLVRALRNQLAEAGAPAPELSGLGGPKLEELGVRTVGDPVSRATMGFGAVLGKLPFYLRLLRDAARELSATPYDLVLPVDSPALHVPLGRIARACGAPVVHYITPQHWGWAPWRVHGYREAVDLALTILPFEPAWFRRHEVPSAHVGHPLLDALPGRTAPQERPTAGALVLLPGSRAGVIRLNLPWMLAAAARLREKLGELEVVLPHARPELEPLLEEHVRAAGASGWVRVASGQLHDELSRARCALSVSGTVLIDLLHHRLPSVVLYRLSGAPFSWMYRNLLTAPFFALPNLLAGRALMPEFCFHGAGPQEEVSAALLRCYRDEAWRADCQAGLEQAAKRLGPPGASRRAALQGLAHALGAPEPPG